MIESYISVDGAVEETNYFDSEAEYETFLEGAKSEYWGGRWEIYRLDHGEGCDASEGCDCGQYEQSHQPALVLYETEDSGEKAIAERGMRMANDLYQTDWDSNPVTSVHIPTGIAIALLNERDWDCSEYSQGGYKAPTGERYWELSEAVQVALTAEVLARRSI